MLETCIARANEKRRKEKQKEIKRKKFKLLCETRWRERHTALKDFHELYEPIMNCLPRIATPQVVEDESGGIKWDTKSSTEAAGLLNVLQSSEFLIAFYMCHYFFAYTKDIARMLQGQSKDVLAAYLDIRTSTACISDARNDAKGCFSGVFQLAEQAANLLGEEIKIPRRCGRQTQRSNHPAEEAVEYWRRAVFIPFADQLISELNGRFNQLATTAASGLHLLPKNVVKPDSRLDQAIGGLQEAFCTDLPAPQSFPQEVQRWVKKWKAVSPDALPKSWSATALAANSGSYPNISCLLHLLLVAPVTSASVERANSSLDFVLTDRRSTMGQDRLNDLILLYAHKDIQLDYEQLVDTFAARLPRCMLLRDPLNHPDDEF